MDYIKNNIRTILIALGYVIVATIVYAVLAQFIWGLWFITLIVGILVFIGGSIIAYFYTKLIKKEEKIKEQKKAQEIEAKEANIK